MQKVLIWFITNIKSMLRNRLFYIVSILMITLCAVFCNISTAKPGFDKVGLYFDLNASNMNDLVSALSLDREVVIFDDLKIMKQSVSDADIAIGYAVYADASDYIDRNKEKGIVEVYVSPGYLYSEVDKERFYNAWLSYCSNSIIESEADKVFAASDESLVSELIDIKESYLSSDSLFDINIIEEDSISTDLNKSKKDPVRAVVALTVFMTVFIMYGYNYSGNGLCIDKSLSFQSRIVYRFVSTLSHGLLIGLVGLICTFVFSGNASLKDIVRLLIFVIICDIFTCIVGAMIKKEDTFTALCPVLLTVQLIICPIIIDLDMYMPIIPLLRYLFPVTYYL